MWNRAFKFLVVFCVLSVAAVFLTTFVGVDFGSRNYWDYHGVLLLIFLAAFPRLTLLFSSISSGGIFWWLGWLFAPRLLVAILATFAYWQQNPVLVAAAWLVAIGGESSEKTVFVQRRMYRRARPVNNRYVGAGEIIDVTPNRKEP